LLWLGFNKALENTGDIFNRSYYTLQCSSHSFLNIMMLTEAEKPLPLDNASQNPV